MEDGVKKISQKAVAGKGGSGYQEESIRKVSFQEVQHLTLFQVEKKGKLRRGNYQINDMREFLIVNEPTEGLLNTINERDPQQSTLFRTLKKYVT